MREILLVWIVWCVTLRASCPQRQCWLFENLKQINHKGLSKLPRMKRQTLFSRFSQLDVLWMTSDCTSQAQAWLEFMSSWTQCSSSTFVFTFRIRCKQQTLGHSYINHQTLKVNTGSLVYKWVLLWNVLFLYVVNPAFSGFLSHCLSDWKNIAPLLFFQFWLIL